MGVGFGVTLGLLKNSLSVILSPFDYAQGRLREESPSG